MAIIKIQLENLQLLTDCGLLLTRGSIEIFSLS